MKLLIADDEPAVRALVHVTLEGDEYEILEAADGVEALEVARDEAPRLVLLDIMMPRLDGLEVCRQLKADPDTSDIVVVMLTAQAQDRDRDQGLAAGADDYIQKSGEFVVLKARVRAQIRRKQFEDENRRIREELLY
ncbi:MAG TPA: response regulator, partial [Actinomycetota bacterium]|nr:response regulator [Actinomycetota bacterium]